MRRFTTLRWFVPAAALLAAACDGSSDPIEPADTPATEAEAPAKNAALFDEAFFADGYLFARNEVGIVTVSPEASWSRSGGPITVTRVPGTTGRYVARLKNLSTLLGGKSTVHVTAGGVGTGANVCKPVGATLVRDSVEVRCYRIGTGTAANTDFSLDVIGKRGDRAFAFANQPTATNYTPASAGSYNPAGATKVYRDGVGRYRVVYSGLSAYLLHSSGGHVQANAVGTGKVHCIVERWGDAPDLSITVECYALNGARADSKFTTMVTAPASHLAYAWASDPTNPSYTPNEAYAFNPMGGDIVITRTGTGAYTVRWNAVDGDIRDFGNAQVTAWGFNNAQCRLAYFDADAAHVRCYGPTGAAQDSHFTVLLGS